MELREGQFLEMTCVWKHLEPICLSHSEVTSCESSGEAEGKTRLSRGSRWVGGEAAESGPRGGCSILGSSWLFLPCS